MILIAFGALAVGFGLAFGLGGRDVIGGILAGYYVRQRLQAGDHVTRGHARRHGPRSRPGGHGDRNGRRRLRQPPQHPEHEDAQRGGAVVYGTTTLIGHSERRGFNRTPPFVFVFVFRNSSFVLYTSHGRREARRSLYWSHSSPMW